MDTPHTPPEMVEQNQQLAAETKLAARAVARTMGSLAYAAKQRLVHNTDASEDWYQRCYAAALDAHQKYRELTNQLFQ